MFGENEMTIDKAVNEIIEYRLKDMENHLIVKSNQFNSYMNRFLGQLIGFNDLLSVQEIKKYKDRYYKLIQKRGERMR